VCRSQCSIGQAYVDPDDLEVFYRQQADPVANAMAAFPARDRTAHDGDPVTEVLLRLDEPPRGTPGVGTEAPSAPPCT
jgi:hypothetical protein